MTLVVVTSPKGGVGVTTVVAELARRLAGFRREVVAVNLTDQVALDYRLNGIVVPANGYQEESMTLTGVVYRHVDESVPNGRARAEFALALRREDAIVIVDVASGDRATRDALLPAADLVLCVLAADAGSLATLTQAHKMQGAVPYCVINLVDERRAFSADVVTLYAAAFGDKLLGTIQHDEAVNESLALLADIAPGSAAANDFQALAARIDGLIAAQSPVIVRDIAAR